MEDQVFCFDSISKKLDKQDSLFMTLHKYRYISDSFRGGYGYNEMALPKLYTYNTMS